MNIRRLTSQGLQAFEVYLQQLRNDGSITPPSWLLDDAESSETIELDARIEPRELGSRFGAAEYLDQVFSTAGLTNVDRDAGLWAWLTLFYFDQVCPAKAGNLRKPSKEVFRYIPAVTNFQKYYRHLLLGPYVIYQAHRLHLSDAMAILKSPVSVINDVVEQIASRVGWVSNHAVVGVATRLYIDSDSGEYKRGSGGKGRGSPRRLSEVLDQFDLTYDLFGMTPESLLLILPKEFDRFRP